MALDSLAVLACLSVVVSELIAPRDLRRAAQMLLLAVVLLLVAGRLSYVLSAAALSVLGLCGKLLCHRASGTQVLGYTIPTEVLCRFVASFIHLVGTFVLPCTIMWGCLSVDQYPKYYTLEVAHLLGGATMYFGLVLFPLILSPPGYEQANIQYQLYESLLSLTISSVYLIGFCMEEVRVGHLNDTALDVQHFQNILVWVGAGAAGLLHAKAGQTSSVAIAIPALWTCHALIIHNYHYTPKLNDDGTKTSQTVVWLISRKLHLLCATFMGAGGVCRLLYRMPESVLLFFLGTVAFVASARDNFRFLDAVTNYRDDGPEGHHVEDAIPAIVVGFAMCMFPVHGGLLSRLRKRLAAEYGFNNYKALPVLGGEEEDSTTDEDSEGSDGVQQKV